MSKKTAALLCFLGSLLLCLVVAFLLDTSLKPYPILSFTSGFIAIMIAAMALIHLGLQYTDSGGPIM